MDNIIRIKNNKITNYEQLLQPAAWHSHPSEDSISCGSFRGWRCHLPEEFAVWLMDSQYEYINGEWKEKEQRFYRHVHGLVNLTQHAPCCSYRHRLRISPCPSSIVTLSEKDPGCILNEKYTIFTDYGFDPHTNRRIEKPQDASWGL